MKSLLWCQGSALLCSEVYACHHVKTLARFVAYNQLVFNIYCVYYSLTNVKIMVEPPT